VTKFAFIILGLICIGFLYTVPIPVNTLPNTAAPLLGMGQQPVHQYNLTISALSSSVDDPIWGGGFPYGGFVGGHTYDIYKGIFYFLWILGLILIVLGLK